MFQFGRRELLPVDRHRDKVQAPEEEQSPDGAMSSASEPSQRAHGDVQSRSRLQAEERGGHHARHSQFRTRSRYREPRKVGNIHRIS